LAIRDSFAEGLSRSYLKPIEVEKAVTELSKKKFGLNAKQTQEILAATVSIERYKRSRDK